jgi:hypothetical protein
LPSGFTATLAEVHKVLDRLAETVIDDKTRMQSLALEPERLDQMEQVFGTRALKGDVACGGPGRKAHRAPLHPARLYRPRAKTLQVIEAQAPKGTSSEKIRRVLDLDAQARCDRARRSGARGGQAELKNSRLPPCPGLH